MTAKIRMTMMFAAAAALLMVFSCETQSGFPTFNGDITVGTMMKYIGNPVFKVGESTSFDSYDVYGPSVVQTADKKIRMFYSATDFSGNMTIGVAESSDGFIWARIGKGPVLTPTIGKFDEGGVKDPSMLFDGKSYWMYYTGLDKSTGIGRIGLAKSTDGVVFLKQEKPVLEGGGYPAEANGAYHPTVVVVPQLTDKKFYMFYTGMDSFNIGSIMMATSKDGVVWEKTGKPVVSRSKLEPEKDPAFDSYSVFGPSAMITTSAEGRHLFRIWYSGFLDEKSSSHVGLAGSDLAVGTPPGSVTDKYYMNPVLQYAVNPSSIQYNNNLYMFFNDLTDIYSKGISLATRNELPPPK
ncbi:MAG: hypothetical protein WC889_19550 [Myxococcota bacterium]